MDGFLQNKTAIITGGASGIGRACARLFLESGARVVLADVQDEKGQRVAEELGPEKAAFLHCDVAKETDVERVVAFALEKFGGLDCMINNAGVVGSVGPITELDMEAFNRTLDVNLKGVMHGIKHAARAMKASGTMGGIVNVASIVGMTGCYGFTGYAAAKAGVIALTKVAAAELAPAGIRVNAVAPGYVATSMLGIYQFGNPDAPQEDVETFVEKASPIKGHTILAEDIARTILYLASDMGRPVNSHTLVADLGVVAGVTGQVSPSCLTAPGFISETGRLGVNQDQGKFPGMDAAVRC